MNRNRKITRASLKRDESDSNQRNNKKKYDLEEVLPPKSKRNPFANSKNVANRSCYFTPGHKDFGQFTEVDGADQYQSLLLQQYGFDPIIPDTINQLKELRKVLCPSANKVDDSSQYISPNDTLLSPYVETAGGFPWQNIEDADEVDEIVGKQSNIIPEKSQSVFKNIRILEKPRIKVIAEKFSKFKKDNVEIRRLDEKVVCIEYDVYDDVSAAVVQKMRVYFSIRPGNRDRKNNTIQDLTSNVKHAFDIADEDLEKLNEKEIEIIDGKMAENKPYVDDLKRVLKRKQAFYMKRNKSSLDLKFLYEMAKINKLTVDDDYSDTNVLTKAELENVKEFLLKNCTSSMYGINKKTIKPDSVSNSKDYRNANVVSQSIFVELLKNSSKIS